MMLLISNDIGLRKAMGSNMHLCFERRKSAGKETVLYSDDASPLRPPADLVVAYLGPGGTHSHLMAIALFGAVDELGFRYEPRNTLGSVLDAVRTRAVGWGVVPYFNTSSGPVRTIYPALIDIEHGGFEDLEVSACVSWPVSHDLLGSGRMEQIERVYSKQEAIDQCSRFLKEHFNPKQILPAESTAEAVRTAEREGPHSAAIASRRVCEFHPGVDTVCQDIQDDRRNLTRFLIIRRRPAGLEPVREHNRHRRMRHTWVVFDSSAQSAVLPRMMAVARDWGIAASTLIGVVTDPSAFGMRFLLELDWPRDSLKVQFLLGDTEHLRRRVVAWPMVADSDQIPVIREWINASDLLLLTMPTISSLEIRLASRPNGIPTAANFTLTRTELPQLKAGEVLVRNLFMSVDPYMRGRMNDVKSYVPPFQLGKPLDGGAIGEVVESRTAEVKPGDAVASGFGWREYFIAPLNALHPVSRGFQPLSVYLGTLGMPGMTAWAGLNLVEVKAGDVVYISGAAGAVGNVAGQLAKLRGCRIIGSAGSAEKVRFLLEECGFDSAFDYKSGPVLEQLKLAAPDGIDVYFDNVGGETLEAALWALRVHGRIVACGSISGYNDEKPRPGPSNLFNMITKRLTMKGLIVTDSLDRRAAFEQEVDGYLKAGKLKHKETVVKGIDQAVGAFIGLFHGQNAGKMVVDLT